MDLFSDPEDRLIEAEYWFFVEELLAKETLEPKEHLEAGRKIDRQIARMQQMQRETAERFKELRESMQRSVPAKRDKIKTMDLERAMEFMLEQQARFQEQQVKFDERHAKLQQEQAQLQAGLVEHDKRLAKAERLLVRGAESLAIHREALQETDRRITALVLAQEGNEHDTKELKASLKTFLDSMSKGGNGH